MLKNIIAANNPSNSLLALVACTFCFLLPSPAQPPDPDPAPHTPVERVTIQQAQELVGGPTLITLNFVNAVPQTVYEELFRQAMIKPRLPDPDLWARHTTPLTVHLMRKPFWAAVQELESQTQLTVFCVARPPGYAINTVEEAKGSAPALHGPSVMSGPFQVIVGSVAWDQKRSLFLSKYRAGEDPRKTAALADNALKTYTLYVLADPKFGWLRAADVQVDEAVGEKGDKISIRTGEPSFQLLHEFPASAQLKLIGYGNMKGSDGSIKIARLKGKIRLVFASETETWEIADPLNSPMRTRVLALPEGREEYAIGQFYPRQNMLSVQYTVTRQPPADLATDAPPANADGTRPLMRSDLLFKVLNDSLSLIDADGAVHPAHSSGGGGSIYDWKYWVNFYYPQDAKNIAPTKLVWKIPRTWKEVEIPFEFTDLPLP